MKKSCGSKITSLLIIVFLFFTSNTFALSQVEHNYIDKVIGIDVYGQEVGRKANFKIGENDVYIKFDDLLGLTGFTCTYALEDTKFVMTRGLKTVTYDASTGVIKYLNFEDVSKPWKVIEDTLWVPMDPLTSYLNAVVEYTDETSLKMIVGEMSLLDYAVKSDEMIASERHLVYNHADKKGYNVILGLSTITDVFQRGKVGELVTFRYASQINKEALVGAMSTPLESILEKTVTQSVSETAFTAFLNTNWFKSLSPYDQVDALTLKGVLDVANIINDIWDINQYNEAVKSISTKNLELLDHIVNHYPDSVSSKSSERLIREGRYLIEMFNDNKDKIIGMAYHQGAAEMLDLFLSTKVPQLELMGLTANVVDSLYQLTGQEANINNKFIRRNAYYKLQKEVVNLFDQSFKQIKNLDEFDETFVDHLYALPIMYLLFADAADKELMSFELTHHKEKLAEFFSINKALLMLDMPKANQNPIPVENLVSMSEVNNSDALLKTLRMYTWSYVDDPAWGLVIDPEVIYIFIKESSSWSKDFYDKITFDSSTNAMNFHIFKTVNAYDNGMDAETIYERDIMSFRIIDDTLILTNSKGYSTKWRFD